MARASAPGAYDTSHRKHVTGNDWKRPDLQQRYAGWFSSYLARKIAAQPAQGAARRAFAA